MILPRLYVIVDDVRWLERLLPLGVRLIQLRIKDCSEREARAEIGTACQMAADHDAVLVVNDYWRLAIELGCRWVHLGQEDLDTADIVRIRRSRLKLGVSTHDEAECDRALSFRPDYVAFGPIYPTSLKRMNWSAQGPGRLAEWKERIGERPLVAIGGLTLERAGEVLAAGADTVAVSTDIVGADDPELQVYSYLEALA